MKEQIIIHIGRSKICGLAAISRKNFNFNIIRRRLHPSIKDDFACRAHIVAVSVKAVF